MAKVSESQTAWAVGIALCSLLWWTWSVPWFQPIASHAERALESHAEDANAPPVVEPVVVPVASRQHVAEAASSESVPAARWWESDATSNLKPSKPVADGITVRVLDDSTGEPVPGALVFALVQSEGIGAIFELGEATVTWLAQIGVACFETDASGETRVSISGVDVHLVGVHRERWECRRVGPEEKPLVELRVRPSRSLQVRAVASDGVARANVPLRFGLKSTNASQPAQFIFQGLKRAKTGDDGVASFEGVDRYPIDAGSYEWGVTLDCPTPERVFVPIDRRALPSGPLDVAIPALGTVRVRVVDASGALVPLDGWASVRTQEAASILDGSQSLPIAAGLSTPWMIATGLQVNVTVQSAVYPRFSATGAGPTKDGEETILDVTLADPRCFDVVGTMVAEDGSVAPGSYEAWFLAPTEREGATENGRRTVVADEDGILRLTLARLYARHGRIGLYLRRITSEGVPETSDRVDVALEDDSGTSVDVGDVALHPAGLVAGGVVVDDSGRAIPGVQLSCDGLRRDRDENPWSMRSSFVRTADDGRFQFFGATDAKEVVITGSGFLDGWSHSGRARVPAGQSDVRLEMTACGSLAGRVAVPAGIDLARLYVAIGARSESGGPMRWSRSAVIQPDGSFLVEQIEPGAHRIGVLRNTARGSPAPLAAVDDVVVEARKVNRDPRLDPISIQEKLRRIALDVADESGAPVAKGTVYVVDRGTGAGIVDSIPIAGAPLDLWLDTRADALVIAPGFRSVWLRDLAEDQSIRLQPGLRRKLRLHFEGFATVGENEELVATLEAIDLPLVESDFPRGPLDAEGRAEFAVEDPGRYRVRLKRGAKGTTDYSGTLLRLAPELLTIGEEDGDPEIAIKVGR